jgi:hypothetical protein
MRGARRGCVRLKGAVIGIDDEDDSTFTITVDHKTFHFQARDAEEREKWVRALEDTIFRHGNRVSCVKQAIQSGLREANCRLYGIIIGLHPPSKTSTTKCQRRTPTCS